MRQKPNALKIQPLYSTYRQKKLKMIRIVDLCEADQIFESLKPYIFRENEAEAECI